MRNRSKIKSLSKHFNLKEQDITQDPYTYADEFELVFSGEIIECVTRRAKVINEEDLGKGIYTQTNDKKYWFRFL